MAFHVHQDRNIDRQLSNSEPFSAFIKKIGADSIFQRSRIKFPLTVITTDIADETEVTKVTERDWVFLDMSKDTESNDPNALDAFKVLIDQKSTGQVIYSRVGIDNGILIQYTFQKEQSRWFLYLIEDKSI